MKRVMYLIALSVPMMMVAHKRVTKKDRVKRTVKEFDIRRFNLDATITKWVNSAKEDGTFDKLPQLINDTWSQIENKNYMVSRDILLKLSNAAFKNALTRPKKKKQDKRVSLIEGNGNELQPIKKGES